MVVQPLCLKSEVFDAWNRSVESRSAGGIPRTRLKRCPSEEGPSQSTTARWTSRGLTTGPTGRLDNAINIVHEPNQCQGHEKDSRTIKGAGNIDTRTRCSLKKHHRRLAITKER
ncbi:hypothetical protein KIN20_019714 [Parelaphostrongylus tenuis]|uniref:Uncharacterized protein n=1 Tax=Parelaphostrongylus tenuis TaxID=148309 RepID=A0AAD5QT62_PARTN|nr:hypothetical protein KIN20_019714 [Parelaphostrongylus tenuis]